jgi:hypothetical protein
VTLVLSIYYHADWMSRLVMLLGGTITNDGQRERGGSPVSVLEASSEQASLGEVRAGPTTGTTWTGLGR